MSPTATLTLIDGARVVVPDSLDLITPYVLREQRDWFEDEIKFLRRLLQPGQNVIDIGANYGVYALSMAQAVGPTGHVWAFEPATRTAAFLAQGIAANGFTHVTLAQSALSSAKGSAQLSLSEHSELNSLVAAGSSTGAFESVPVTTLDDGIATYGWRDIEFVKIDAEGEEANILKGGEHFLSGLSPLIQYEIKAGDGLHLDLVAAFKAHGYDSYRLVPGLDVIIPFDADVPADGYLLNLFCCKPDRAARLADRGFLVGASRVPDTANARSGQAAGSSIADDAYDWRRTLAQMPYGALLAKEWERTVAAGASAEVVDALRHYARSRDPSLSAADRLRSLEASFARARALGEGEALHLRLATLARIARDYGARSVAVAALAKQCETIFRDKRVDTSEPFLAPGERFDTVRPASRLGDWVLCAALEELERAAAFSSFYSGVTAADRLELIRKLGFGSAEMQRRLILLRERFGSTPPQSAG